MEKSVQCWGNIRIIAKKMETTILFWDNVRIMEKKMEATILTIYSFGKARTCSGVSPSKPCDARTAIDRLNGTHGGYLQLRRYFFGAW